MPDLSALQVPRWIHRPSASSVAESRKVDTHAELARALTEGWVIDPNVPTAVPVAVEHPTEPEPAPAVKAPIDEPVDAPKHKGWPKGKPRKVAT